MLLSRIVSGVATNNITSLVREINQPRKLAQELKIAAPLRNREATKLIKNFNNSAQAVLKKLQSQVEPKRTLAQSLAFVLNNDAASKEEQMNVSETAAFFDFRMPIVDTTSFKAVNKFFADTDEVPETSTYAMEHEFDALEAFTKFEPSLNSGDFEPGLPEADKSLQLDIANAQAVLGILFKTVDSFCDLFRKNFLEMENIEQTEKLTQELELGLEDFHEAIDLVLKGLTKSSLEKLESVYLRMHDFFFAIRPDELITEYYVDKDQ